MNTTKLTLTRNVGQSLTLQTIDGPIVITQRARHKLTIEAPPEVVIMRDELIDPVGEISREELSTIAD